MCALCTVLILLSVSRPVGLRPAWPAGCATPLWGNPPNEGPLDPRTIKAAEEAAAAEKARKDAERKAADAARRQELEQQATPPATPQ